VVFFNFFGPSIDFQSFFIPAETLFFVFNDLTVPAVHLQGFTGAFDRHFA
jgi:hypothetical protein